MPSGIVRHYTCRSCGHSDNKEPEPKPEFSLAASVNFGCSPDELRSAQELAGNTVGTFDIAILEQD